MPAGNAFVHDGNRTVVMLDAIGLAATPASALAAVWPHNDTLHDIFFRLGFFLFAHGKLPL